MKVPLFRIFFSFIRLHMPSFMQNIVDYLRLASFAERNKGVSKMNCLLFFVVAISRVMRDLNNTEES